MSYIIFKYLGSEDGQIELQDGNEYIVGRGENAHLQLKGSRSISREHLRISQQDSGWKVELISKFGTLIHNNESVKEILLTDSTNFSLPPYEVEYFHHAETKAPEAEIALTEEITEIKDITPVESGDPTYEGSLELTSVGQDHLGARLLVQFKDQDDDLTIELKGHKWVVGRDESSDIVIDHKHLSRKHFEIIRTNDGFYIQDLESSNGTMVNGEKISTKKSSPIFSGDSLTIKNIEIRLEVRDLSFEKEIFNLPATVSSALATDSNPLNHSPVVKVVHQANNKAKLIRILAIVIIPLLVAYSFLDEPAKKEVEKTAETKGDSEYTDEQMKSIDTIYKLAKNYYIKANFNLCISEIDKLHQMIPAYEESKDIENYCKQGKEIEERQAENERLEEERAKVEEIITDITDKCSNKVRSFRSLAQLESCLAPAVEYNPLHPRIESIKNDFGARLLAKEQARARSQARRNQINKLKRLYSKAQKLEEKSGADYKIVIKAYEKVIKSKLPDPNKLKSKAKRNIASINQGVTSKAQKYVDACRSHTGQSDFKNAILSCRKALKIQPSNIDANNMVDDAQIQLLRGLKPIYEDAILEEQLGSVESAKEKYKKILNLDLPDGKFYKRAKNKLKGL